MKKKDILYIVLFVAIFVSIIGLLMAWNDGYLEGTLIESILNVTFLPLVLSFGILIVITAILNKLGVDFGMKFISITFIISFVALIFLI